MTLRREVLADIGTRDATHIRRMRGVVQGSEIVGRGLLMFGIGPVSWVAGVIGLSLAKIVENMEIGHNVMHGQYDWMNDPSLHSQTYEWDIVCDGDHWRHSHNVEHHDHTNVLGQGPRLRLRHAAADAGAEVDAVAACCSRCGTRCWR